MDKFKKRLTSAAAVLVLSLSLWASLGGRGYAQEIDMEAARRESDFVFYSAARIEDTDALVMAITYAHTVEYTAPGILSPMQMERSRKRK